MPTFQKAFKVAMVASNTNSFGLTGMILVSKDGEAWEVAVNDLYKKEKSAIINLPLNDKTGKTEISSVSFPCELPRQLPKAPANVVNEVWA